MEKIVALGLPRSGNQSLAAALGRLVGSCVHGPGRDRAMFDRFPAAVEVYIPPAMIEQRYQRYGSEVKYILNTRNVGPWLTSCKRVYEVATSNHWRHLLWRRPLESFGAYRNAHYARIREFAATIDASRFLEWDVTIRAEWAPLCEFLGLPEPTATFPRIDRFGDQPDATAGWDPFDDLELPA